MAKIAFISTMGGIPWGGSEFLWAATAKQSLIEGHEVIISVYDWTINNPIVKELQYLGAYTLTRSRSRGYKYFCLKVVNRLAKFFNQEIISQMFQSPYQAVFDCKPDIICISQGGSFDLIGMPELSTPLLHSGVPYVFVCQFNSDILFSSSKIHTTVNQLYHQAKKIAFVSKHNLNLAERQLCQNIPNALVIQNPVNLVDYNYVHFPLQTQIKFACVARLHFIKGQDLLFEALSSPEWQKRNWQCNLYGSGEEEYYLKSLANYYNLSDRIHFHGHVQNVQSIWVENQILVLPSRGEGTPLALVESMICGRPAVITDVGGNIDWIEEGKTGFIAEAPTTKLINAALNRAWQFRDQWQSMGKNAHTLAMAKRDPHPENTLLNLLTDSILPFH
jgi:glycosyltransferase involved in cell wall biosynthesis